MKFRRMVAEFKIPVIFFIFGVLWIIFSDKALSLLITDSRQILQIQTYKGWFYVTISSIFIYYLIHKHILIESINAKMLEEDEEKFRLIYSMSYDAIFLTIPDGTILAANPAACKMFGMTEGEICRLGRQGLVDSTDPELPKLLEERSKTGKAKGVITFVRKDGTKFPCEASSQMFLNNHGKQLSSLIIRDISGRIQLEDDLRRSEEKFNRIFKKSSFAATLSSTDDGKLIEVNEAFENIFGYSENESIGKTTYELGINPDEENRKKILAELQMNSNVRSMQIPLHTKSGELRIFAVNVDVIEIAGKKYILNTTHDITEQKNAEEKVRHSEENLRKAQGYANIGSWTWFIPTNTLEWSDQMFKIFGIDKEKFSGNLIDVIQNAIHPDDREMVNASNNEVVQKKNPTPLRYRIVWPNGEIRTVWAEAGELVEDKNGTPEYLSGIVQDITEKAKNEEKINLQATALEVAANAIVITDSEGLIQWVNSAYTKLTGYTINEIIGQNLRILFSGFHNKEFFTDLWNTISTGNVWQSELINRHKDGHIFSVEETITPIEDISGKIINFVGINEDITKRKESEKKLVDSEERLRLALSSGEHGIYDLNLQTDEYVTNDIYATMLGYDPSTFTETTQSWLDRMHPEDRTAAELYYSAYIHGKIPEYKNEYRQETTSGKWIWMLSIGKIVEWDDQHKPVRMIGTHTDITETKELFLKNINLLEESQRRLRRIETLRKIDLVISSNHLLPQTLKELLAQVKSQLGVDAATILLLNEETNDLTYAGSMGIKSNKIRNVTIKLGESLAGKCVTQGKMVHEQITPENVTPTFYHVLQQENFKDYFCIPLISKDHIEGVLELFNCDAIFPDLEWIQYYETLAGQAAIAIENSQLFEGLQKTNLNLVNAYDATIEGWSKAMDLRDKETEGHTKRVTEMTVAIAKRFKFTEEQIIHLRRGALLHDIGKVGIPDSILLKPGILTPEERDIMQKHPIYAYDMLQSIDYLQPALEIPHLHHERWDGTGYPFGLKGTQIPLSARMFAIVDVYDALRSDRPYRPALSESETVKHIKNQSGKHFDPEVVKEFLKFLKEK
jgi:PAS domain S-box-containing protein